MADIPFVNMYNLHVNETGGTSGKTDNYQLYSCIIMTKSLVTNMVTVHNVIC